MAELLIQRHGLKGAETRLKADPTLWQNLLQGSAPTIGTAAGANIDYVASLAGQVCTYTYQAQGGNDTIVYDAANGTVVTNYVP